MQLFDSHAHLDDDKFNADLKETAEKIAASDVSLLVDVGSNIKTSEKAIKIAEQYPFVYAAVGIHPCDAFETDEEQNMQHLKAMAAHERWLLSAKRDWITTGTMWTEKRKSAALSAKLHWQTN